MQFFRYKKVISAACVAVTIIIPIKGYASNSAFGNHDTLFIPYNNKNIVVDGELGDWRNFYSHSFSDTCQTIHTAGNYLLSDVYPDGFNTENIPEPLSKNQVDIMLCWDISNLYAGFKIFDKHLIAEFDAEKDENNLYLNDAI